MPYGGYYVDSGDLLQDKENGRLHKVNETGPRRFLHVQPGEVFRGLQFSVSRNGVNTAAARLKNACPARCKVLTFFRQK